MDNLNNPLNIVQDESKSNLHYFRMNILDPKGNCVLCRRPAYTPNHVMAGEGVVQRES